ncbi:hypothetical protein I2I05_00890 [Hymenobacter sp. BT683]|uniref:Uncharacterized protein n=1 Tax=Hymenobacter jeongseonensis TaxID=2791027 RepID=A0ABS0IDL0_9BACT|nr:hypothetical protein [Hymenobacter jeongseonensis]MBF9235940.1 hypothetical protein [Hymenobacter jeongseonensis]
MTSQYLLAGLLAVSSHSLACAQINAHQPSSEPPVTVTQAATYGAAYDSLMQRVVAIRNQSTARIAEFKAMQGSMGGLHRKIKAYAGSPQAAVSDDGTQSGAHLVTQKTIKHRFGIELEKVVHYDANNHVVLRERYENRRLTRLELFEYKAPLNSPVASWLFVRGDYLRHTNSPVSLAYKTTQQKRYYYSPRSAGE